MLIEGLAAIALTSVAVADPPNPPRPGVTIDLLAMAQRKEGCRKTDPKDDSVLVCGRREEDRFRIDPDTLAVLRQKNTLTPRSPHEITALSEKACNPVGQFGCLPGPAINIFAVAGVVARLARGESIASITKTQPDDYDYYKAASGSENVDGE